MTSSFPNALPDGYRLHWYVLGRVLGQGGFGITYLAQDTNLGRSVAVKEFFPAGVARRLHPRSCELCITDFERFSWGLKRFVSEARNLARFDHPNIVRVLSVFEANGTAYMVMRFEEGEDLASLLDSESAMSEPQLLSLLHPILDGLQIIHATGFIHRDIKPENIYVRRDGSPVLLDFGSARSAVDRRTMMTVLIAPGYAPLEQYYGDPNMQGPWTDIYGLAATLYRSVTGHAPIDAVVRVKGVLGSTRDMLPSATETGRGRYSDALLCAIDHALKLSERERPQSIEEWRTELPTAKDFRAGPAVQEGCDAPLAASTSRAEEPRIDSWSSPDQRAGGTASAERHWVALSGAALAVAALILVRDVDRLDRNLRPTALRSLPGQPSTGDLVVGATRLGMRRDERQPPIASARASERSPVLGVSDSGVPAAQRSADPTPVNVQGVHRFEVAGRSRPATPSFVDQKTIPPATASTGEVASPPAVVPLADAQDTAERALSSGEDAPRALAILAASAAAGSARAQRLLGQAREAEQSSQGDFQAYVWYGIAARGGDVSAAAAREKLGARLQPAEVRQADHVIDKWTPPGQAASAAAK